MPRTRSLAYSELKIGALSVLMLALAMFLILTIASPPSTADPVPRSTDIVVDKVPGTVGSTPSAVDIELHYASEINVGDDLLVDIHARSVDGGALTLHIAGQGVTASPNPVVLRLPAMAQRVSAKFVLSTATSGNRKVLVSGTFSKLDTSQNVSSQQSHPPQVINVEPTVIAVEVIPSTTFGLTDAQLKAAQTLSTIILAVLSFVIARTKKAPKDDENKKI